MKKVLLIGLTGVALTLALATSPSHANLLSDFTFERWCTEIAQKDAATCAKRNDSDVAEYQRLRAAISRMQQEDLDQKCRESSQPNAMKDCRLKNYEIDPNPPAPSGPGAPAAR
jgi:hypothetical protein